MVAYSFQKRFAPRILDGTKDQTIRAPRANGHAEPGNALQLYTGMRTRQCRLIARTTCADVLPIKIVFRPVVEIEISGVRLDADDLDAFARRDGFADLDDLVAFWSGPKAPEIHRFSGFVIRWTALHIEGRRA